VKLAALERGIPVSQPVTLKTEAGRADLAAWQPDVLVVVAYGLILPRAALELPRLGCVNIHASLLPRWRGAAPIQRAILAGDAESGVSIMRMDVGLDTGPVFLERKVTISPQDTGGSLHDRLAALGASAVVEVLNQLAEDCAHSAPQREDGVTYAAKIDKAEALIDWARPAIEIERQVRAFNPWPIAETRLDGEQLRIYTAHALQPEAEARRDASAGSPSPGHIRPTIELASTPDVSSMANVGGSSEAGRVVELRSDAIVVACGSGLLAVTELQRPGKKPVAARDLMNTLNLAGRRLG
jgi:methionyl-tRNA formyltransferase